MGKNERTNERAKRNESTRNQKQKKNLKGLTNSRDSTLHARYPYTKRSIYLSRAVSRTHARTTPKSERKRQRPSIRPSIHSSLTTSYREVYLPATKGNLGHGIRGRAANQSEREREIHFVSAISPSTTSSHLSTPHISTPFSTPTPPTTTRTTTAIQSSNDYITPHPTRSSFLIHPFNYKVCDKLVTVSQSISQSAKPSCSFPRDSERNRETEEESQRDRREKEGVTLSQPAVQLKRYAKIIALFTVLLHNDLLGGIYWPRFTESCASLLYSYKTGGFCLGFMFRGC